MILRRPPDPERDFVKVRNSWVRDDRLSRRARGLLAELLSHVDGWSTSVEDLVRKGPEGRDAIHTALRELREAGYLRVQQGRGDRARLGAVEYVIESPPTAFQEAVDQEALHPETENPRAKKTSHQKTTRENTTPQNGPSAPQGRGRHGAVATMKQKAYLRDLLNAIDERGARPIELEEFDVDTILDERLDAQSVSAAIDSAIREGHHLGQDPDRLGDEFVEVDELWRPGGPRQSGVWS
jgi:hypothetical protein